MLTWDKAYAAGSNYVKPIHSFSWAQSLALEGWHCETPILAIFGYRLILKRNEFLIAKFDSSGNLVDFRDCDEVNIRSKQWRLWTDNGKLIKEEK